MCVKLSEYSNSAYHTYAYKSICVIELQTYSAGIAISTWVGLYSSTSGAWQVSAV